MQNHSYGEEAIYEMVSHTFSDTVISVKADVGTGNGDEYERIVIYKQGMNITRWSVENYCEYYWHHRCTCIHIENRLAKRGIHAILIQMKQLTRQSFFGCPAAL